jgi:RNA recognition motif-containing protein
MLILVWNLSPNISEDNFRQTFEDFGKVSFAIISSSIFKNKHNGQLRGFGFVEMPYQSEAQEAIKNLNRQVLFGQKMIIYESSIN